MIRRMDTLRVDAFSDKISHELFSIHFHLFTLLIHISIKSLALNEKNQYLVIHMKKGGLNSIKRNLTLAFIN
jgi:hypothetical protein